MSDKLQETWTNIRKNIFFDTPPINTPPREPPTPMGISFLYIIVKPVLKLLDNVSLRTYSQNQDSQMKFLKEECKKIFTVWTRVEPNHIAILKEMLLKFRIYSTEEWTKAIPNDTAYRLYRNTQPPKNVLNLVKLRLSRLIELLSKVTTHAIGQLIRSNNNGKTHNNEINFVTDKILSYMIFEKLL